MKRYILIASWFPQGMYSSRVDSEEYFVSYSKTEREDFIKRWEYLLNDGGYYYADVKAYFLNFQTNEMIEITDKLNEIKDNI